jgi:hypothetical protein
MVGWKGRGVKNEKEGVAGVEGDKMRRKEK